MIIGYLILRDTFLKTMGSLIETTLQKNHEAILFYDQNAVSGTKSYQQITQEKLAIFEQMGARLIPVRSNDLTSINGDNRIDVLIFNEGYYFYRDQLDQLKQLRNLGVKIISLCHFYENIRHPLKSLDYFDQTFYLSQFAVDAHFAMHKDNEPSEFLQKQYDAKYEVTGSPMFDQLRYLERQEIRNKFQVPEGKKVVVFFTPVVSKFTDWRFYLWSNPNKLSRIKRILIDRKLQYLWDALRAPTLVEIAQSIRSFCDRSNAFLIVKSRVKQSEPLEVVAVADLFLSGEEDTYFPLFTSYAIASIADLGISVMSMSVPETIAAGAPVLNIHVPHEELSLSMVKNSENLDRYIDVVMSVDKPGPFNYPGCVETVDRRLVTQWLENKTLDDIVMDHQARQRYLTYFLGISAESSSQRILRLLEQMLQAEKARDQRLEEDAYLHSD